MNYTKAIRHLRRADPVMRRLIKTVGPCRLHTECTPDEFATLVDAIIYQQISYKAAMAISRRVQLLYADGHGAPAGRYPAAAELLATPPRKLRAAGLSRGKVKYVRDLARKAAAGRSRLGAFHTMSDDEVIENVTQVKGIGRWTAEMFLIFCLRRPDVLPVGDLGVQYGFKSAYALRKLPSESKMTKIAEAWRPHRTIGTWYLWRARRKELGIT